MMGMTFSFETPKSPKQTTNGAGCTLSAAIAALLATDRSMTDAVQQAKDFVLPALKMGYS